MKTFGIYLAYPPSIRLANEGLGRFLAEFLRAAADREDARFVVACPGWMRQSLAELCSHAGIPDGAIEILAPAGKPGILILADLLDRPKRSLSPGPVAARRRSRVSRLVRRLLPVGVAARLRSTWAVTLAVLLVLPLAVAIMVVAAAVRIVGRTLKRIVKRRSKETDQPAPRRRLARYRERLGRVRHSQTLLAAEMELVHGLIARRPEIAAWYCPNAFWPEFNRLNGPRLLCVPDFVVADFPVEFARIGGDAFGETVRRIERTIATGDHFVTYSDDVRRSTLLKRFGIEEHRVSVVPHGANRLDRVLDEAVGCVGTPGREAACRELLRSAMKKAESVADRPPAVPAAGPGPFLFYASQIRPNKNVGTLLTAFHHLVRTRFVGHRLVMTGSPHVMPEIAALVSALGLQDEVLFLRGLSEPELAACYHLADLAVNPSLSEGGCPFTFTEAVSVDTPVVMARIPVTEEVIVDPLLQSRMLFDPYDWRDVAATIERGLADANELLALQKPLYHRLARRSWREVVGDHVAILEHLTSQRVSQPVAQPTRQAG
jgi:glycosyltransferase involved in cell wall biosynthesis